MWGGVLCGGGPLLGPFLRALRALWAFQPKKGDFVRDILQKMVWREGVLLGCYGQIRHPYAGFAIWEVKNPWVFVYFNITTAIGVSVFAMRWPKTYGFLHILALQLRQGYQVLQCDYQNPMGFCIFRFTLMAAKLFGPDRNMARAPYL